MKKNLKVTGKVQIDRHELVKILNEMLQATEDLCLERAVAVDSKGEPVEFDSFICYVHQIKSDEISDKYDPPRTVEMKKGFSRPNYGLGKRLKDIFSQDGVIDIDSIMRLIKDEFPHLTKKQLRRYLTRPNMTGCKLEIDGNKYWNPKGENSLNLDTKTKERNG